MSDVELMLADRERKYGNFLRQAMITADIKHAMMRHIAWSEVLAPDQREALEMIAVKIARIVSGDANYADNWIDIAGYSTLVFKRLVGDVDEGAR